MTVQLDWSQELRLAAESGRSVPTVKRWARGQAVRPICNEQITAAAKRLGLMSLDATTQLVQKTG